MSVREANDQTCEAVRFELPVERARPIVPGPVSVDVAIFQTSEASVPKDVSERVALFQTFKGIVEARDVDAVRTVAFVLLLIVVTALVILFAKDVEALSTFVLVVLILVLAVASELPRLVEAFVIFVFAVFTLVAIVESVLPRLVEAFETELFVFALITPAIDVEAVFKLAKVANEPTESVASVRLRVLYDQTCEAVRLDPPLARTLPIDPAVESVDVATFQTADTRVPNVSSERPLTDHTFKGIVAASEVDAVRTVAFVLLLIGMNVLTALPAGTPIEDVSDGEGSG